MKTLNVTIAALAIVATSASAALALDGPHNAALQAPAFSDAYVAGNTVPAPQAIDATSAATTRLNDAGIRASQH